jgi:flavin reductase (DIM6/NTAB) family NADH-FMN oxidoreductase RutF
MSDDHHHPSSIDSARFRQVLGHFPTGVVVVAAVDDGEPVGLAIGSFASVSLDPPLVGFFPDRSSTSWPRIEKAGSFAVNILGEHQEDICRTFASKGGDKFSGIGWKPGHSGSPIIDGVVAWIDCEVGQVVEAGDHFFVTGKVLDLDVAAEAGPLLFFRGGYGRLVI